MNTVEKVKSLCKERGIAISKLEKELDFANGYISQLKKGTLPDDRLLKICNYLNVEMSYFTGKEEQYTDEKAHMLAKIATNVELSNAMLKYFKLSDAKKKHVLELIEFLSEK